MMFVKAISADAEATKHKNTPQMFHLANVLFSCLLFCNNDIYHDLVLTQVDAMVFP